MYEKISIRNAIQNARKSTSGKWELRKNKEFPSFVEAPRNENMAYGLDVCGDDYTGFGEDEQREINFRVITRSREMAYWIEEAEEHLVKFAEQCLSTGNEALAQKIKQLLERIDE